MYQRRSYQLLDDYHTEKVKMKTVCPDGHIFFMTYDSFRSGQGCPLCGRAKQKRTLYENGTAPCSMQQKHIAEVLSGELNYPVKELSLDIAFPNDKIYIEYDGSGHDLNVKRGDIAREEFDEKEKRRAYALYRSGWLMMRIISHRDKMPSDSMLITMFETAKMLFDDGHHFVVFDIDNSTIKYRDIEYLFDFGKVKVMKHKNQHGND